MKDKIYDLMNQGDEEMYTWPIAQTWGLHITAQNFHKQCRELVKEKRLKRTFLSGVWHYELN